MDGLGPRPFILVVDDNQDLARNLSILLKLSGFDVETVHDGLDALESARARRPDVVLLDIGLPGMDGFEVAEQMRSDPLLKGAFVVAISGYDPGMFQDRFEGAGFDYYLVKPVAFTTITSIIAAFHRRDGAFGSVEHPRHDCSLDIPLGTTFFGGEGD